jgi:hypothetical protein
LVQMICRENGGLVRVHMPRMRRRRQREGRRRATASSMTSGSRRDKLWQNLSSHWGRNG